MPSCSMRRRHSGAGRRKRSLHIHPRLHIGGKTEAGRAAHLKECSGWEDTGWSGSDTFVPHVNVESKGGGEACAPASCPTVDGPTRTLYPKRACTASDTSCALKCTWRRGGWAERDWKSFDAALVTSLHACRRITAGAPLHAQQAVACFPGAASALQLREDLSLFPPCASRHRPTQSGLSPWRQALPVAQHHARRPSPPSTPQPP